MCTSTCQYAVRCICRGKKWEFIVPLENGFNKITFLFRVCWSRSSQTVGPEQQHHRVQAEECSSWYRVRPDSVCAVRVCGWTWHLCYLQDLWVLRFGISQKYFKKNLKSKERLCLFFFYWQIFEVVVLKTHFCVTKIYIFLYSCIHIYKKSFFPEMHILPTSAELW